MDVSALSASGTAIREDAVQYGMNYMPESYGGQKLACEELLLRAATDSTLLFPCTIVRPPAVVGPGGKAMPVPTCCFYSISTHPSNFGHAASTDSPTFHSPLLHTKTPMQFCSCKRPHPRPPIYPPTQLTLPLPSARSYCTSFKDAHLVAHFNGTMPNPKS